jgi:hypothetical protein
LEAEKEKEAKLNADYNLELLRSKVSINAEAKESEDDSTLTPFCLFDDPATAAVKKELENAEYLQEKKRKLMAEQRAQGIAPLALGDKSAGSNQVLPWYVATEEDHEPSKKYSETDRKAVEEKLRMQSIHNRELKRKRREDPMNPFIKYTKDTGIHNEPRQVPATSMPANYNRLKKDSGSCSNTAEVDLAMLRKKRLEREAAERKKASLLLNDPQVNERFRIENNQRQSR